MKYLIAGAVALILALLYIGYLGREESRACNTRGGAQIRTYDGYTCIKVERL